MTQRTIARLAGGVGLTLAAFAGSGAAPADEHADRVRQLVERVARGDEVESAAAAEQLIELLSAPLAEAIGPLDSRPVEEVLRIRRVLARLNGALRMRIFRMDLPPEDRSLFDRFAAAYPELVERAFDDHYAVRRAAVLQIPLEPNTGAGVLIAGKVNDEDEDVATAALSVAGKLRDAVVARNLTRYIADATGAVAAGLYGPEQQDIARTVALLVLESMKVVAGAKAADSVPALAQALSFFGRSRYWDHYQRSEAIRALGGLGDRRATAVLLEFLDDPSPVRTQADENGQRVTEAVGDVALLCLLRLYELNPQDFGLIVSPPDRDLAGFASDEARREGHRAFRIWYDQRTDKLKTEQAAPATRPADQRK